MWLIGEIGEVIDVVKKNGDIRSAEDIAVRNDLVGELSDVLMYFNDVLLCYGITSFHISKLYRNMKRR